MTLAACSPSPATVREVPETSEVVETDTVETEPSSGPPAMPSALVCSLQRAGHFAVDWHFLMGCPPNPRPVRGERPCARWGERPVDQLRLRFREDGRVVAGVPGLSFHYDGDGRLDRIDGALEGDDTPVTVDHDGDHVTYSLGPARRFFTSREGRLETYVVAMQEAGEAIGEIARWSISRTPERVVAQGEMVGGRPRAVTRFAEGRAQVLELDLEGDGTVDIVERYIWEGARLVRIELGEATFEVRYGCGPT